MGKSVWCFPAWLAALMIATPATAQDETAQPSIASRFTELNKCTEIANGDIELGQDWNALKCDGWGAIPVWLTYADSARSYLGFGEVQNLSGPFGLKRKQEWVIEWRGRLEGGQFAPFATIIRMTRPDMGLGEEPKGMLFVYRLYHDGLSCLIGEDIAANEQARAIADASLDSFACLSDPQIPGLR